MRVALDIGKYTLKEFSWTTIGSSANINCDIVILDMAEVSARPQSVWHGRLSEMHVTGESVNKMQFATYIFI